LTTGSTSGLRVIGLGSGVVVLGRDEKLSLLPMEKPEVTEATLFLTDAVVDDAAFLTEAAVDDAAFLTELAVDAATLLAPPRKSSRPFLVLPPTALTVSPTLALTAPTAPTLLTTPMGAWPTWSSGRSFLELTDWMTEQFVVGHDGFRNCFQGINWPETYATLANLGIHANRKWRTANFFVSPRSFSAQRKLFT